MKLPAYLFVALIYCSYSVLAERTNSLIAHVLWPRSNAAVICEVHEQRSVLDELPTRELSFIDSCGKHLTAVKTPDSLVAMYPIGDENALFVTVWGGGSAYHIRVFNWRDNKPYCVLESGSKAFPEIVFDVTKSDNTFFFLNDAPGGTDNPANWITTCYRWDNKMMTLIKKVPSGHRFEVLPH